MSVAVAASVRRELTPPSERPRCLAVLNQRQRAVSVWWSWAWAMVPHAPRQRQQLSLFGWWVPVWQQWQPCQVVGPQIHQSPAGESKRLFRVAVEICECELLMYSPAANVLHRRDPGWKHCDFDSTLSPFPMRESLSREMNVI